MRGPIPNSYTLLDGRLVAGEYPGAKDDTPAREKLGALLDAGVTTFIDLTEPHELKPYAPLLGELAKQRGVDAKHVRHPIRDVSVPKSSDVMREILDEIDTALERGGKVYVHCWGGVGRTGIVVGCHLVRGGMTGDQALARVAELFKHTEKYPRRLWSPETDEQDAYVRSWTEQPPNVAVSSKPSRNVDAKRDRIR